MDASAFRPASDILLSVALVVTLWATGIGLGMSVRPAQVVDSLRRRGLVTRMVLLDLLLVPVAMWVCVRWLALDDGLATGLLLVAFAAAGPLAIKLAHLAGGDVAFAVGIVIVLEVANVLVVPLWASQLGLVSTAAVAIEIVRTLLLLVLLPLTLGLFVGRRWPARAPGWAPVAARVSSVGLVVVVCVIVGRDIDVVISAIETGAALASVVVVALALLGGWLFGGPLRATRVTASMASGVRANGVALAIATTAFADRPEVAVGVVTAGLVSIVVPTLVAGWFARSAPAAVAMPLDAAVDT